VTNTGLDVTWTLKMGAGWTLQILNKNLSINPFLLRRSPFIFVNDHANAVTGVGLLGVRAALHFTQSLKKTGPTTARPRRSDELDKYVPACANNNSRFGVLFHPEPM